MSELDTPTDVLVLALTGSSITNKHIRECDARTPAKYRAESLVKVFRMSGQVDLGPHLEYETRTRVSNNAMSVTGGLGAERGGSGDVGSNRWPRRIECTTHGR